MKQSLVGRGVLLIGAVGVFVSCGPKTGPTMGGRGRVEGEFKRCQDQEQYGAAKGCWKSFLDTYAEIAGPAEIAFATEHLDRGASPTTPGTSAPVSDEVAAAAKAPDTGLVRLDDTPAPTGGSGGGFPPQTVGYKECYQGFSVTGDSERDVAELGRRCGAPCGMVQLSGIQSDSQQQADNVDTFGLTLRADRCYRFFAVGSSSITDLDSAVADSEGHVLIKDVFQDPAPILAPDAPFCPETEGRYKFIVSVAKGGGAYHFQVWQGPKR